MHLELSLLGPFQATIDGEPIPKSRSKKIEALLIYLAMEANMPHRRETLVGLLFPDLPDEIARTNLRQILTRLRRAIQNSTAVPPFLLTTRETTQFNQESDSTIDVHSFNQLLQGCERHRPTVVKNCPDCIANIEAASNLYRGPFLEGFFIEDGLAFDDWVLLYRERYHQAAIAAFQTVTNYFEYRGEFAKAQRFAERLLEVERTLGRERGEVKWEERTLDIDILFYNDEVIATNHLKVPHPHLQERNFVLVPLNEIEREFVHPVLQKNISTLLNECKDSLEVVKIESINA